MIIRTCRLCGKQHWRSHYIYWNYADNIRFPTCQKCNEKNNDKIRKQEIRNQIRLIDPNLLIKIILANYIMELIQNETNKHKKRKPKKRRQTNGTRLDTNKPKTKKKKTRPNTSKKQTEKYIKKQKK